MDKVYTEIYFLDSFSSKVSKKRVDFNKEFLNEYNLDKDNFTNSFDKKLFTISKEKPEKVDSLLALRCRVSSPILEKIKHIYNIFSENYDIELQEMLILTLNDGGERFLRIRNEKNKRFVKMLFCWETINTMHQKGVIQPFGAEIIFEFNPDLSNLSTWAKNKVQGNYELKSYLRNFGILLFSHWSLIADSSRKRIISSWERCGEGKFNSKYIIKLYESYIVNYKKAKKDFKRKYGKISGWEPDRNFLISLDPPQKNIDTLVLMSKAIRQYISSTYTARQLSQEEESQIKSQEIHEIENSDSEIYNKVITLLKNNGLGIVHKFINEDKNKWVKDSSRKLAWELYSKGLSQREIASKCNHKQAWVSKLLPEKRISEEIAQETALEILKFKEFINFKEAPEKLDNLVDGLQNFLLIEQTDEKISLLRQFVREEIEK